jgi:hypothetical protein
MFVGLLITGLIVGHPIGNTTRHYIGPISFELPSSWRVSSRATSVTFDAPDGRAYLMVDADAVERTDLTGEACLDIILERLAAGPSWRKKSIDAFAAAEERLIDRSADLTNQAVVNRVVGCDGHFSWSLVMFTELAASTYYGQVIAHVTETLKSRGLKPGDSIFLVDRVREQSARE